MATLDKNAKGFWVSLAVGIVAIVAIVMSFGMLLEALFLFGG